MRKIGLAALVVFLIFNVILFSTSSKNGETKYITTNNEGEKVTNISDIAVLDINKKKVNLKDYNGKVILIVNVASKCGYTKQYAGLQELYNKYKSKGFEILAFPCNDFGGQEPGTNEEIKEFCSTKFDVKFQLFDKIAVLGEKKAPLYAILTDNSVTGKSDIKWNFEKFLIDKNGSIISRYRSNVEPMSDEMTKAIEKELLKK